MGARLRGRTATQRSKKGSEKVLGKGVLGKDSQTLGEYAPLGVRLIDVSRESANRALVIVLWSWRYLRL